jgi:hypothetical protein
MAYGKNSKIDCDTAFYDDCHCRRRRDVGDSRGGPQLWPVTARGRLNFYRRKVANPAALRGHPECCVDGNSWEGQA